MSDDSNHNKIGSVSHLESALDLIDKSLAAYPDDDVFIELREQVDTLRLLIMKQGFSAAAIELASKLNWHAIHNLEAHPEIAEQICAACVAITPG